MIIVEGPDRCGKSTLVEMLSRQLPDWKVGHFVVPDRPVLEYHMDGIEELGAKSIVDRLHWSEYAYGLTYRGRCGYDEVGWAAIEERLHELKAHVVLLTDWPELIEKRWAKDGEPFDKDRVRELVNHFGDLRSKRSHPRSILTCQTHNFMELVDPLGNERFDRVRAIADYERGRFT